MLKNFMRGVMVALLVTAAAVAPQTVAQAQAPPAAVGANPLNLTAAQQKKIQALNQKYMPQYQAILKSKGTEQQKMAKMQTLRERMRADFMKLLTPQQRTKAASLEKQIAGQMRARAANVQSVAKTLTPQQKKQLETIQAELRSRATAVQNDKSLTNQQKSEKIRALILEGQSRSNKVLTPKQRARLR